MMKTTEQERSRLQPKSAALACACVTAVAAIASTMALAQPPEGRGPGDGFRRGRDAQSLIDRLMNFDADNNGTLSKEEIPERLHGLFARADKDEDGALTTDEITADLKEREGSGDAKGRQEGRRGSGEGNKRGRGPGGRQGGMRGRQGRGPHGPGGHGHHGPPPNPIIEALDTDHDGEISSTEIDNAAEALKELDQDSDGKLDRSELRPPRPHHGPGGKGDADPAEHVTHILKRFDTNGDETLSGDEIPERMQQHLKMIDTNEDGAVDKSELEAMAKRRCEKGKGGPGKGSGRGGRRGGRGGDRGPEREGPPEN